MLNYQRVSTMKWGPLGTLRQASSDGHFPRPTDDTPLTIDSSGAYFRGQLRGPLRVRTLWPGCDWRWIDYGLTMDWLTLKYGHHLLWIPRWMQFTWNMIIDYDMILCSKDEYVFELAANSAQFYFDWLAVRFSSLDLWLPLVCAKSLVNLGVSELPDRLVSQTFKIAKAAYYSKRNWTVLHHFEIILINFEWVLPHSWSIFPRFRRFSWPLPVFTSALLMKSFRKSEICKFIWVPRYHRFANLSGSQGIPVSHPRNNFDPGVE